MLVGNILYGLAYYANWLYLILIGRMICGLGYTFWMYNKRYARTPVSSVFVAGRHSPDGSSSAKGSDSAPDHSSVVSCKPSYPFL